MISPILNHPIYAPLLAAILGAIWGSFVAALVGRWPLNRSIMQGRSRCDACGQVLRWYELVPIISYLIQQGRCRRCADQIDSDSIAIEIAAALIGAVPFIYFLGAADGASSADDLLSPGAIAAIKLSLFGWLLLPLAWLDFRHYWLPDRLNLALALGAVVMVIALQWHLGSLNLVRTGTAIISYHLLSGLIGFAILWFVSKAYVYLRGREGLGGGDPKLFGAIGMWTGWEALPFILLCAAVLGLILALVAMAAGRDITGTTRFPFGTLLALSAWPLYFYQIQGGIY